ncbi:class A beta-lactamase-related serine hydrolase [Paenibacillus psychroresistens]|uniref:Class A beta-lactamase-related serine hydrolase n=1 Tax=Paenibacillus psychroresistens TaxID=1778678 RepID=A0A6B8RHZ3_9BACL|nr:serine hydrolase domain-containing protein [Paenibacillus psychroresistens]QGQ95172.1 class A beta-lactamase-related serine hydrolase [Paenibacillus psychroresistens]
MSNHVIQHIEKLREQEVLSCCSVSVSRNSIKVFDYAAGYAFPGSRKEVTKKTRFNIGSITKPITASLLIMLVEKGRIALHDSIDRYIPGFKFPNITILQMMTHISGFDGNTQFDWPKIGERKAYYSRLYDIGELKNRPGEVNEYFSHGYSILTDILERVTGESIESYARRNLFEPLGMLRTTFDSQMAESEDYVLPLHQETMLPETNLSELDITGDSGLYSTAEDLLRFGNMLLQGGTWSGKRLFSIPAVRLMFQESTGNRFGRTPAFWIKTKTDMQDTTNVDVFRCFSDLASPATVGHNGFSGCMFFLDPTINLTAVILTNSRRLHADGKNYAKWGSVILSSLGN